MHCIGLNGFLASRIGQSFKIKNSTWSISYCRPFPRIPVSNPPAYQQKEANRRHVQDYGAVKTLALCPATPNCLSTAEEVSAATAYSNDSRVSMSLANGSRRPVGV